MTVFTDYDVNRVVSLCQPDGECWIYTGTKDPKGYGRIWVPSQRRRYPAHRVTYEGLRADIPDGLVIDHLCRTRPCCNPWHMEPVTNWVNTQRGENTVCQRKTHCIRGHALTPDNVIPARTGGRHCRTCKREYNARRDRRKVPVP